MTTSIHKEALAEAKKIRELAFSNAKKAVVESIAPQLGKMIDQSLLSEGAYEEDTDGQDILLGALSGQEEKTDPGLPIAATDKTDDRTTPFNARDGVSSDITSRTPVSLDDVLEGEGDVELTTESINSLAQLVGADNEKFSVQVLRLSRKLNGLRENKSFSSSKIVEKIKQLRVSIERVYTDLQEAHKKGLVPSDVRTLIEENLESVYSGANKLYVPARIDTVTEGTKKIVQKAKAMNKLAHSYKLNEGAQKVFGSEALNVLKQSLILQGALADVSTIVESKKVSGFSEKLSSLSKEIYNMAKKHGTINENQLKLVLKGLPDGIDLGSLEVGLADDMGGEDDMDMGMGDEMDPMGLNDDDMGMDDDMDPMGMDDDMDDDPMGMLPQEDDLEEMDLAIDVDLPGEVDFGDMKDVSADISAMDNPMGMDMDNDLDMDMDMDMGPNVGPDMDMDDGAEDELDMDIEKDDEMVEISEASLRQEIARLRKVRKLKEMHAKTDVMDKPEEFDGTDHGPEMEDQFGGASDTGEPFVDRDDSDLNTLGEGEVEEMDEIDEIDEMEMDELDEGSYDEDDDKDDADDKDEGHDLKESKMKKVALVYKAKYKKANAQLKEANLWNAKLVYTQKLLQNENLKPQERLAVIEALDGAESLREAKKLFATMNKTFGNKDESRITESVKKAIGASSRVRKGGGATEVLNESDKRQLDRWSLLSGITD